MGKRMNSSPNFSFLLNHKITILRGCCDGALHISIFSHSFFKDILPIFLKMSTYYVPGTQFTY